MAARKLEAVKAKSSSDPDLKAGMDATITDGSYATSLTSFEVKMAKIFTGPSLVWVLWVLSTHRFFQRLNLHPQISREIHLKAFISSKNRVFFRQTSKSAPTDLKS